jgi:hypothetical protein
MSDGLLPVSTYLIGVRGTSMPSLCYSYYFSRQYIIIVTHTKQYLITCSFTPFLIIITLS